MDGALPLTGVLTSPECEPDPATWDAAPPREPNPQALTRSIEALRLRDPELAIRLANAPLPANWRPVHALDGWPATRTELPGEPAAWLNGAAAPRVKAKALLATWRPSGRNVGLLAIGDGAELSLLLERLPRHCAVFVLESDLPRVAAVLQAIDFSREIEHGRLILLPEADEDALWRIVSSSPGLFPPAELIAMPDAAPSRTDSLCELCRRIAERIAAARETELESIRASLQPADHDRTPRLAILALDGDHVCGRAAAALRQAAERLNWGALACVASTPHEAHPLPHARACHTFRPTLAIGVRHVASAVPLAPGVTACQWRLDESGGAVASGVVLAATPSLSRSLVNSASPARVLDFWWACDSLGTPPDDTQLDSGAWVAVIADLPASDPEAHGVIQPTHRRLWEEAGRIVASQGAARRLLPAEELLLRAERTTGFRIGDADLRERMVRIIERALIPAVTLPRIIRRTQDAGLAVKLVGRGWSGAALGCELLSEDGFEWPTDRDALAAPPVAAIFGVREDSLTPALLHVAARGWPILAHDSSAHRFSRHVSPILTSGAHYLEIPNEEACTQALRDKRRRDLGRRTRAWLLERHRLEHRLRQLAADLSLPA